MKNRIKLLSVIALAAVIGFTMTACGGGGGGPGPIPIIPPTEAPDLTQTFTSIAAFKTWLDARPANTAADAYNVKLNVSNLSEGTPPYYEDKVDAGSVLRDNSTKYVNLDLSGSTITGIWPSAFSGCTRLVSVTIPNSVTSIEYQAFFGCTSLTSITVPFVGAYANNGDYIGEFGYLFGAYPYNNENSAVPSTLKTVIITGGNIIDVSAFRNCTSLTSITIPNSVTSIGRSAFSNCTSLASVTIPDSVISIGSMAFSNTRLTSVTIPDSVTSIGIEAFHSSSITSVTFQGTITSANFYTPSPFYGDLRAKYLADGGGIGTYTRSGDGTTESPYIWTKQ